MAAIGMASSVTPYTFTDLSPLQGINLYRVKQLHQDGGLLYSSVAGVVTKNDPRFAVIRNPVQGTLQLRVRLPVTGKLILQVRAMNGHLLIREERMGNQGDAVYARAVDRITSGSYIILVQTGKMSKAKIFQKR